jgi:hypothetical protein
VRPGLAAGRRCRGAVQRLPLQIESARCGLSHKSQYPTMVTFLLE